MHKFFPVYVRNITVNISVLLSLQDTWDYFYFFPHCWQNNWQKQLSGECSLAYSLAGSVHHGKEAMKASLSKARCLIAQWTGKQKARCIHGSPLLLAMSRDPKVWQPSQASAAAGKQLFQHMSYRGHFLFEQSKCSFKRTICKTVLQIHFKNLGGRFWDYLKTWNFLFCIHRYFAYIYVCMTPVYPGFMEARSGLLIFSAGVTDSCELACGHRESNQSPLEE